MVVLCLPDRHTIIHVLQVDDRQTLMILMDQLALDVERLGATGVLQIAESWFASIEELKFGQSPSDLSERRELLTATAATADGRKRTRWAEFFRREDGSIEFGQADVQEDTEDSISALEPIRRIWRCWREQPGPRGGQ